GRASDRLGCGSRISGSRDLAPPADWRQSAIDDRNRRQRDHAEYPSNHRFSSARRYLLVCTPGAPAAAGVDHSRAELEAPRATAAEYGVAHGAAGFVSSARLVCAVALSRGCARAIVALSI